MESINVCESLMRMSSWMASCYLEMWMYREYSWYCRSRSEELVLLEWGVDEGGVRGELD